MAIELEEAAARAMRRGAPAVAAAALERAAELSSVSSHRGSLLVRAAEMEFELGRAARARELLAEAIPLELDADVRSRLTFLFEASDEVELGRGGAGGRIRRDREPADTSSRPRAGPEGAAGSGSQVLVGQSGAGDPRPRRAGGRPDSRRAGRCLAPRGSLLRGSGTQRRSRDRADLPAETRGDRRSDDCPFARDRCNGRVRLRPLPRFPQRRGRRAAWTGAPRPSRASARLPGLGGGPSRPGRASRRLRPRRRSGSRERRISCAGHSAPNSCSQRSPASVAMPPRPRSSPARQSECCSRWGRSRCSRSSSSPAVGRPSPTRHTPKASSTCVGSWTRRTWPTTRLSAPGRLPI